MVQNGLLDSVVATTMIEPHSQAASDIAQLTSTYDYGMWGRERARVFNYGSGVSSSAGSVSSIHSSSSSSSPIASVVGAHKHQQQSMCSSDTVRGSASSTFSVNSASSITSSKRYIASIGTFHILRRKNKKAINNNTTKQTLRAHGDENDEDDITCRIATTTKNTTTSRGRSKPILTIDQFDAKMQRTFAESAEYFDKHPEHWAIARELSDNNGIDVFREAHNTHWVRVTLRRLEDFLKYCKSCNVHVEKRVGVDGRGVLRNSVDQLYARVMATQNKHGFDPCRRGNGILYQGVITTPCQLRFLMFVMQDGILQKYIELAEDVELFSMEQRNLNAAIAQQAEKKSPSGRRTRHVHKRRSNAAQVYIAPPGCYLSIYSSEDDDDE